MRTIPKLKESKMEALISFKHKSMKDYWSGGNYQYNKVLIQIAEDDTKEDIERTAEFKILDTMEILYPKKDGVGYDVCYQYEITKVLKNPYNK